MLAANLYLLVDEMLAVLLLPSKDFEPRKIPNLFGFRMQKWRLDVIIDRKT